MRLKGQQLTLISELREEVHVLECIGCHDTLGSSGSWTDLLGRVMNTWKKWHKLQLALNTEREKVRVKLLYIKHKN